MIWYGAENLAALRERAREAAVMRQARMRAKGAARRARRRAAVPAWCGAGTDAADDIADFYLLAPVMTAAFNPSTRYEVDHIKPLARGGEHRPDNLTWLPAHLNASKGAKWTP